MNKMTQTQKNMLATVMAEGTATFPGTSLRSAQALAKMGLVTYKRETYSVRTGTFPYNRTGVRVIVTAV